MGRWRDEEMERWGVCEDCGLYVGVGEKRVIFGKFLMRVNPENWVRLSKLSLGFCVLNLNGLMKNLRDTALCSIPQRIGWQVECDILLSGIRGECVS